ncbi:hypothetical protein HWV62_43323 [Athelia sp. TMB]|nr:hypothetical protein HWV62_43323 [Athelia sp. TMB]
MGLNTEHTVYLNVYQNFVLTAMKMHRYIRTWGINTIKNSAFIERAIQQIILHTYTSIRNKGSNHVARVSAGRCEILKTHVNWLGTHAFYTVLARKSFCYAAVVRHLKFDLCLPRQRVSRRRFRSLVKEGLASMTHITF